MPISGQPQHRHRRVPVADPVHGEPETPRPQQPHALPERPPAHRGERRVQLQHHVRRSPAGLAQRVGQRRHGHVCPGHRTREHVHVQRNSRLVVGGAADRERGETVVGRRELTGVCGMA
jgi:hypothetical protein